VSDSARYFSAKDEGLLAQPGIAYQHPLRLCAKSFFLRASA